MNVFNVVKKVLKYLVIISVVITFLASLVFGFIYLDAKIDFLASIVQDNQEITQRDQSNFLNNDFTNAGNIQELERLITQTNKIIENLPEPKFDVQKASNSVIQILDGEGMGSGTVIKKTDKEMYILTCHHVVSDAIEFEDTYGTAKAVTVQYFKDGADIEAVSGVVIYKGYVEKYNKEFDLAIVRVDNIDDVLTVTPIASEDPNLGDTSYTIGNPLGVFRYLSKGILSNKTVEKYYYCVDGLTTFGNSGGAVFNIKGELIGVPSKVPTYMFGIPESNMGFIVSTPTIRNFTRELLDENYVDILSMSAKELETYFK